MRAGQLHGVSIEKAECYGKPHIMARYTGGIKSYEHEEGLCPLCHRAMIVNTHHQPDRTVFTLRTEMGIFALKPALFGICGSGTTGCHGLIEANRLKVRWEWDRDEFREAWWSGHTLSHFMDYRIKPHSELLYEQGRWVFEMDGRTWEYRGETWSF